MSDWTRIEDALPEIGTSVLVMFTESGPFGQHCVATRYGQHWSMGDRWGTRLEDGDVTHWMEIPKPEPRFEVKCSLWDLHLPGWYKVYDTKAQQNMCYFRIDSDARADADRRNAE